MRINEVKMTLSNSQKEHLKKQLTSILSKESEVRKIVLFGSFIKTNEPNDIDVAIFQESDNDYISLALKYRKLIRDVTKIIPVDILPLKENSKSPFLQEVEMGEVIYER